MPPKSAKNRVSKEPEFDHSPEAVALQLQIDGMARFCSIMGSPSQDFIERLQKHKKTDLSTASTTAYQLSEDSMLQIVQEVRQAEKLQTQPKNT